LFILFQSYGFQICKNLLHIARNVAGTIIICVIEGPNSNLIPDTVLTVGIHTLLDYLLVNAGIVLEIILRIILRPAPFMSLPIQLEPTVI
jgi:hypothetical protein